MSQKWQETKLDAIIFVFRVHSSDMKSKQKITSFTKNLLTYLFSYFRDQKSLQMSRTFCLNLENQFLED